ncbi:hypothetical protein KR018_001106 [Drosophila ironensis]|nr:hypothetical protein KR018_001106 [Drosophila ironensis]
MFIKHFNSSKGSCVTYCRAGLSKRDVHFYLVDVESNSSLKEQLEAKVFETRLQRLNPRVKFPIDEVQAAMFGGQWTKIKITHDDDGEYSVVTVKYMIKSVPVPINWKWHLGNDASFYLLKMGFLESAGMIGELQDQTIKLLKHIKEKDAELEQYRREGFRLRRNTVVTERFDTERFEMLNSAVYNDATTFLDLATQLRPVLFNINPIEEALSVSSPSSSGRVSTATVSLSESTYPSPNWSTTTGSSDKPSPRNKKRKMQDNRAHHLECKVKQRSSGSGVQFKNSQSSQEEGFEETKPTAIYSDDESSDNDSIKAPSMERELIDELSSNKEPSVERELTDEMGSIKEPSEEREPTDEMDDMVELDELDELDELKNVLDYTVKNVNK